MTSRQLSPAITETGFLLINKPSGPTSHDIVYTLRRLTGIQKVGHAGTLDPLADGLLIVAIGREATKHIDSFMGLDKSYRATITLGATSTTDDAQGDITPTAPGNIPSNTAVRDVCAEFVGVIDQLPPDYSAKKKAGKKMYERARAGETFKKTPSRVTVHMLDVTDYTFPHLTINVHCSKGTYIRSLARDIGEKLGIGGYISALTRTSIGPYALKDALDIDTLTLEQIKRHLFQITR